MVTKEKKHIIDSSNTYLRLVEEKGEDFLTEIKKFAITADMLKEVVGEQNAQKFMQVNVQNVVDEWLLFDGDGEKKKVIIDTNSMEMNNVIKTILELPYVDTIYEFKTNDSFDLWVIVNDYAIEKCREIYRECYELEKADIMILEKDQLNVSEMPAPVFIFTK